MRTQTSTLLDNIYTNIPDCYDTGISGILIFFTQSDHYPVFTIRNNKIRPKSSEYIKKRIHNNQNISKFKKSLVKLNWPTLGLFEEESISSAFSLFMNTILFNYQNCFPIETIKLKYKNRNPWIKQELKNDIKIRDRLYTIQKKNPSSDSIKQYKQYKNQNLSKQRKAERDYYREQFEMHKHDLKKSWKVIKNIIGKEDKSTSKKQTIFLINNQYTTEKQTIANSFNNYFINVGSSLSKNITSGIDPMTYVQYYDKSIEIPEINKDEICSVISSLSNSAAGYDEIPASIMKPIMAYFGKH